jgi:hypothetical protein
MAACRDLQPARLPLVLGCVLGVVALACEAGCSSGPARVAAAAVDIETFVQSLLEKYDGDGNQQLSSQESEGVPAIHNNIAKYDANGDGQLAADEITNHLQRVFDGSLGLMGASCQVTHNGRPLAGAIVYFVPLPGLEDELPVAGAVTQSSGIGELTIRPEDLPANAPKVRGLMRPGLYFVEVTHPTVKIPEKYNVKTTLGQEISPERAAGGPIQLALKF